MTEQPNIPGPGEDADPANREMEGFNGPVPVGDMPGEARDHRRRTLEMRAVELSGDAPDVDHNSVQRRTGTERDGYAAVRADVPTEQRLDGSAHDLQRESVFDAVPDDAGPQSDKC